MFIHGLARSIACLAGLMLVALGSGASAAPPEQRGEAGYFDGYHRAMMQLREGRWNEAVTTLSEAEKLARGDGRLLLARGVVRTLQGELGEAYSDLDRVRLQDTREPQLWKSVIDCMTNGQLVRQLAGGRGQHWFGGVPGHLVQGGKDYRTNYASFVVYDMAWPHYLKLAEDKPFDEKAMAATKARAGRWFANRMLATKDFSSRNFAAAKSLLARDSLVSARELLDFALAPYPFDADMKSASGDLWLRVGRPATARADYTQALTIARRRVVDAIAPRWVELCERLAGVALSIHFHAGWDDEQDLEQLLAAAAVRDRERGTTTLGPHRADLRLRQRNRAAREVLSRGQQKLAAVALTLDDPVKPEVLKKISDAIKTDDLFAVQLG